MRTRQRDLAPFRPGPVRLAGPRGSAPHRARARSLACAHARALGELPAAGPRHAQPGAPQRPVSSLALDQVLPQRYLLSGAVDGSISLHDLLSPATAPPLLHLAPSRRAHTRAVSCLAWYPHDNGMFLSSSMDEHVVVWDPNAAEPVLRAPLGAKVYAFAVSPSPATHTLVAIGTGAAAVRILDLASGAVAHTIHGHRSAVMSLAWHPLHDFVLLSGSQDGTIRAWDVRKTGCLATFANSGDRNLSAAHTGIVNALQFVPGGLHLLSSGTDARVRLWDACTARHVVVTYPGIVNRSHMRTAFAVTPDGATLFHSAGAKVRSYDVSTGAVVQELSGHFDTVTQCVWNPTREELYTAGSDGLLRVWAAPSVARSNASAATTAQAAAFDDDQDAWSDDDDET